MHRKRLLSKMCCQLLLDKFIRMAWGLMSHRHTSFHQVASSSESYYLAVVTLMASAIFHPQFTIVSNVAESMTKNSPFCWIDFTTCLFTFWLPSCHISCWFRTIGSTKISLSLRGLAQFAGKTLLLVLTPPTSGNIPVPRWMRTASVVDGN